MEKTISKLVRSLGKGVNKIIDPNKEAREIKNKKLRNKYATDDGFKKRCEAHRIANSNKRKILREAKLSKIKIEKERCYLCGRKDKVIVQHHPDYTKPILTIPLCRRCHARLHSIIKQTSFLSE